MEVFGVRFGALLQILSTIWCVGPLHVHAGGAVCVLRGAVCCSWLGGWPASAMCGGIFSSCCSRVG
ncbi:hypothetical protein M758_UG227700 [Ceratodon purpureus]|nr:hypothetical protein M758_UG227700 [Ceratodon purpureus]